MYAGPARSFTFRETPRSDFYASVDVLNWNNDVNQAFGFLFRGENIGLGQTTGYVMNYDPQQGSGGRGQIQFNIVTGEADQGTVGAANLSLEPGRSYHITLSVQGSVFIGQVYDLNDLTSPIVTYRGGDDLYSTGLVGLFNFYRGGDDTDPDLGIADTTFDNYFAGQSDPGLIPPPGTSRSIDGWPHVASLEPLNRATFHPADAGVSFTATTLSDQKIAQEAVKFWLNGSDVSNRLDTQEAGNDLEFKFTGLNANTVYDARIELSNASGQTSITEWTFDTFSDAFLESNEVKVIEVEDYNFGGGEFINDPPPAGVDSNLGVINLDAGYLDREGIPEIDFFDWTELPDASDVEAYRIFDPVETQTGSVENQSTLAEDLPVNDIIRKKYSDLDLPETQVGDAEGGEWFNYTREFSENSYNVFLRVAARATQAVLLDEVIGDPTQPNQATSQLGAFQVPNLGMEYNYRFVPLLDEAGNRAVLELSGRKTLRLTLGGERENRTNDTMALNYLVFVPALEEEMQQLIVESAVDVNGPFEMESAALVSEDSITIPVTGPLRFFRFVLPPEIANTFAIQSVTQTDASLVIGYSR